MRFPQALRSLIMLKSYATHWSLGQKGIAKFLGSYKALLHKLFLTDFHLENMYIVRNIKIFWCIWMQLVQSWFEWHLWGKGRKEGKPFFEGQCFILFLSFGFLYCQESIKEPIRCSIQSISHLLGNTTYIMQEKCFCFEWLRIVYCA